MKSHFSILSVVIYLLLIIASTRSEVHYYFTPLWNDLCPQNTCLTLSQFAANSSSYLGNETNISLFFLPGHHDLDGEVFLLHLDSIVMIKAMSENQNSVIIECDNLSGRFKMSETIFVSIKGLQFIGCEGNEVSKVEQFIVEDSIFWGVKGRNTVLLLNDTTSAKLTKASFFSNTMSWYFSGVQMGTVIQAWRSSFAITNCTFANSTAGGMIFAMASSFSTVSCTFIDTMAAAAGVIGANQSSFNITDCNFDNSIAYYAGGITVALESLFNVNRNSTFTNNVAASSIGVIATSGSSFTVSHSNFTNNVANDTDGVIATYESSFSITTSNFYNNSVYSGGVISTGINTSFDINESNFTDNDVIYGGAVIHSLNSSFSTNKCTFTDSGASLGSGVVFILGSSSTINLSTFSSNRGLFGGAIYNFQSSLTISSSNFNDNSASE